MGAVRSLVCWCYCVGLLGWFRFVLSSGRLLSSYATVCALTL
ncbi:hypothetical protein BVRB_3g060990 [Beta vulgaris subsp. vulgaris]|nr:hypothetical protein BVRB_3g060990 [Beta vulgaris subsp. vulgaris]